MANLSFFLFLLFIIPLSYARIQPQIFTRNAIVGADLSDSVVIPVTPDENLPENEIGPKELIEKLTEKGIESISDTIPVKELGSNDLVENIMGKEIGNNELDERLPEDESHHYNNFAEIFDMMLPERKPGDSELTDRLPETEINTGNELDDKLPEADTETVKSMPLAVAKFHPVNRHFRLKWRISPRPCHHQHHRHHHLFPYSGDMLIPTGENGDFDPVIIHHHRFKRIPPRWISLPFNHHHHHHHDHNDEDHDKNEDSKSFFKHSARFRKEKLKKHLHHDNDVEEDEEENSKQFKGVVKIHKHEQKDNGFLQRIRKMLIF